MRLLATVLGVVLHFGASSASESLAAQFDGTNFNGNYHADGNIFEVRASADISITGFDVNIDAGSTTITIRTKAGVEGTVQEPGSPGMTTSDIDDNEWPIIHSEAVTGQGKNNVTPLSSLSTPLVISAGSKQAFWISTSMGTLPNMWYIDGVSLESVYESDANIELLEGWSIGSNYG
ncbi:hypothetical protein ACHAXT_011107 [Thalassiosira profunda]